MDGPEQAVDELVAEATAFQERVKPEAVEKVIGDLMAQFQRPFLVTGEAGETRNLMPAGVGASHEAFVREQFDRQRRAEAA